MIPPEQQGLEGEPGQPAPKKGSSLKGDRVNVCLLMFLYTLQGIPMGLGSSVPMILQSKGVSYNDQAIFSLVGWPFSIKLLWAPIVDSVYSEKFGRRKSWLVPAQYLIGICMLTLSSWVDFWIEDPEGPRIVLLTGFFFVLLFLAATQDVAVDGWALSMLKRENVGYASTCNSVGQTAGFFMSFFVFMALESADFCNTYLRTEPLPYGVVTLSSFLEFFGWIFLVTTTLVMLLKRERLPPPDEEPCVGILDTYKQLLRVMRLPALRKFSLVLLTMSISFSACDAITWLKLVGSGVPRDKYALVTVGLIPIKMFMLFIFSKRLTGEKPMNVFMKIYPFRLGLNLVVAAFIWATPYMITKNEIPLYFYGLMMLIYGFVSISMYTMFVAKMAFFARSSDPALGGTYMTLMNTLNNIGSSWPNSLSLLLVEPLTFKRCPTNDSNTCSTPELTKDCAGGCLTQLDGYYVLIAACTVFGILWLMWAIPVTRELQRKDSQEWKVKSQRQRKLEKEKSQILKGP
uniref:Major facilitator superfamily (MFS) profile domain-containing protein n=1 Tax=Cuerna arida TaxID=1464854 RepID=A0A1B6GXL1_9HEMI